MDVSDTLHVSSTLHLGNQPHSNHRIGCYIGCGTDRGCTENRKIFTLVGIEIALLSCPLCSLVAILVKQSSLSPLAHHRGSALNLWLVCWDFCDRQSSIGAGFSVSPVVTLARYCASVSYSYVVRRWYSIHWYQGTQLQHTVA